MVTMGILAVVVGLGAVEWWTLRKRSLGAGSDAGQYTGSAVWIVRLMGGQS